MFSIKPVSIPRAVLAAAASLFPLTAQQPPSCPPPVVGQPAPFPEFGPGNILGAAVAEVGQLSLAQLGEDALHVGMSIRRQGRTDWDIATGVWRGPGQPVELDGLLGQVNTPGHEFHLTFSPDLLHAVWETNQGVVHASRMAHDKPFGVAQPIQGMPPLAPRGSDPALAVVDGSLSLYVADPSTGGLRLLLLDFQGPLGSQQLTVVHGMSALAPPPGIVQLHSPCPLLDVHGRCHHLVLAGDLADGSSVGLYATATAHGAQGLGVVEWITHGRRLEHPAAVCGDVFFATSDGSSYQDPLHVPLFAMSSVGLTPQGGLAFPHVVAPRERSTLLTALNLGVMTPPAGLGQNGLGLIDYGDACLLTVVALPAPAFGCDALLDPLRIPALPLGTFIDAQAIALDPQAPSGRSELLASNSLRLGIDLPTRPCPRTAAETRSPIAEQIYPRLVGSPFVPVPLPASTGPIQQVFFGAPLDAIDPFVPLRDYYATVCPTGQATMTFLRAGTYYAEVFTQAGRRLQYMVCVSSAPAEGGTRQPEARYRAISRPTGDVVSIESQQTNDNCFDDATATAYWGESRHASVATANATIGAAYQANGNRPVDVVLGGHGNSGVFTMGAGQGAGAERLRAADIGRPGTATQAFITANRGKIGKLTLFGCSVAKGAAGRAFLQALADALSTPTRKATVCGWTKTVCAAKGLIRGSLSVVDGAQRVSARGR